VPFVLLHWARADTKIPVLARVYFEIGRFAMRYAIIGVALLLCAAQAWADDLTVSHAWARATAPGQDSGSIQFSVKSKKEAKLVAVSSPVAGAAEIHSMTHEDGKMKMRAVESVALPRGREVDLGKNGGHVMLLELKQPLKAGEDVPFTLTVEFADKHKETVNAKAHVRAQNAGHDDMKGMEGM
jgi:copper(I)-binding protein